MASTSYNQTPSASTSSTPTLWDVFISFRGIDTRYTFTDHLYKALHRTGIRTFKDNPELRSGEVISDSLIEAITESKTYIVILSENYASSSWCLDELVEILSCYKRMKRLLFPVFYNIDPSVVRHQIGSFKEAFEKHQSRFELEKVDQWRLTLQEVADFSGYHISKNMSEADSVDEVVSRVLLEINPRTLDVAKYPVGLDSRVKGVTALFNSDREGVIRIGIHGMGGVGKTTLAKAVYNQNYRCFQGSCFLADVREVSRTKGLLCLQQQLMNDILKRKDVHIDSVDQGIALISARICSTKVLVVIDDLDDPKPLKYLEGSFAFGSMVIITTRNEDLLDRINVKAKYKVNLMDKDESHQLFSRHAFGECKLLDTFTEMSKEILEHAGGLPLALQVFGSTLLNESEEGWRWFIEELKRAPIDDVEENLMTSFDALKSVDPNLQDIFLDIACFYCGSKKEEVTKVLETGYMFVNRNIDILKKRCLITIDDKDKLGMHDLLRDMGREIACNNSQDEPEKHSRLWISEDIDTVLKNHKGTRAIQGIIISSNFHDDIPFYGQRFQGVSFAAQTFKTMSKLRFLYLNNVNLTGSFEHIFEDLRWFYWKRFPLKCLPSGFHAKKLVTLKLPRSNMRTMWELNKVPQVFENLKTLSLWYSSNLTTTPDFSKFPFLKNLNLAHCISLEEVHISIGSLVSLVSLNLRYCGILRTLPDSLCSLRALEVLDIGYCDGLEALPTELGKMESLKKLNAGGLNIWKLPNSIGGLGKLVELDLRNNKNLRSLPDSICNLISLEILNISDCRKLEELPDQLGMMTSLRELRASKATELKMLPGIYQLISIEDLYVSRHRNLKWIEGEGCTSTKRLPDLSYLKPLEILNLANCSGLTEIHGSDELTLQKLYLTDCNSSLLTYTLTKRLFQILSGFGHKIEMYIERAKFSDWIGQLKTLGGSRGTSLDLQPNELHSFQEMILCCNNNYDEVYYSVKNITSGFIWSDTLCNYGGCDGSLIVIVPSFIFPIRDGDQTIELTSEEDIKRIYLLYKTEFALIDEYASTMVNVEDGRSYASDRDLESNKNWLSLGSSSTTVNVDEERRHPSKRLKSSEREYNWLSL